MLPTITKNYKTLNIVIRLKFVINLMIHLTFQGQINELWFRTRVNNTK